MKLLKQVFIWFKTHVVCSLLVGILIIGGIVTVIVVSSNKTGKTDKIEETSIELKEQLDFEVDSDVYLISLIKKISNGELLTDNEKIDTSKIGKKEIIIEYLDEKEQKKSYKFNINIVDTTPPSIQCNKELSTTVGSKIDLLKDVVVQDNSKEDIKATVEGEYDFNKSGTYNLKYVGIDSSGNKIEEDFVLKVNSVTIKTSGYYVYKGSNAWYQITFRDNKNFIHDPWYCPGSSCGGGGTERGTYKVNGNIVNVNIPAHYTEGDPMIDIIEYIDEKNLEIKILSDNKISLNGNIYVWQNKDMYS